MANKPSKPSGSYRNPPEHTRFRKGQSGNPRGRPKGSKNFRTLVDEELEQKLDITENGRVVTVSKRHIIAKSLVNEAAKGNPRAWNVLLPMISGGNDDDSVEIDPITAAMIASYLARYRPGGDQAGPGDTDPDDDSPDPTDQADDDQDGEADESGEGRH